MEQGSPPHTIDLLFLLGTSYLGSRNDRTEQGGERHVFKIALPIRSLLQQYLLYREAYLYHDCLEKDKGD
jgi:hypothetical protein